MRGRAAKLVVLNAALAAMLAVLIWLPAPAGGQPTTGVPAAGGSTRARGTYTMLAGKPRSGSGSVVYLVDSGNQEAVAVRWSESRNILEGVGYRNLARDIGQTPGR